MTVIKNEVSRAPHTISSTNVYFNLGGAICTTLSFPINYLYGGYISLKELVSKLYQNNLRFYLVYSSICKNILIHLISLRHKAE